MLIDFSRIKIYLRLGFTDMRKSINGLSILVQENMELDPFSGHLFVFCNKRRNILKILYWDRNGFCIWHKKLEKDRFKWPKREEDVSELEKKEFSWLLDGLDIEEGHKKLQYKSVI